MPTKTTKTEQISITLNDRVIGLLEELTRKGLHGNSRGEVARTLIMSRLEQLASDGYIRIKDEGER